MKTITTVLSIFIVSFYSISLAEQTDQFKESFENYKAQYNFYSIPDTMFRMQSEFELPEGYKYIEPQNSKSYTYWVANFPIWHQFKSVGNWKGPKAFNYDEVSRAIHLPWKGSSFKDAAIPVRILGEFNFQFNTRFAFEIMPKSGELLTYTKWLQGKPVFNQHGEVLFKEDIAKKDTEDEYYSYLIFCMQNISYESVANSCDTIAIENLQAGDMLIAFDEKKRTGKLFIIFHLISNESGNTMYLVANGCPDACDLHIQKFNENRDNPWIEIEKLQSLTADYNNGKFYRFRTNTKNDIE